MTIIGDKIVGAAARSLQGVGLHRHAGDERCDVIGRAPKHAVGKIGDAPVADHASLQVVARPRAQKVDGVASAVLFEGHFVAQGRIRLHVVERRDRLRCVAERRMSGDVVDPLRSDINHAAVADRFKMLFSRTQHGGNSCQIARMMYLREDSI